MGGPARIDGEYVTCTDNFQICKFKVDGEEYISAEHYFQASKCVDLEEKQYVKGAVTGGMAWSFGNRVKLVKGWDAIRVDVMYKGNFAKFEQNSMYKDILINSKGRITCGVHKTFWNRWNAIILERIREELRNEKDRNEDHLKKLKSEMNKFRIEMTKKLGLEEKKKEEEQQEKQ